MKDKPCISEDDLAESTTQLKWKNSIQLWWQVPKYDITLTNPISPKSKKKIDQEKVEEETK